MLLNYFFPQTHLKRNIHVKQNYFMHVELEENMPDKNKEIVNLYRAHLNPG